MNNREQFQKELKALLIRYDAEISFECSEGSDTHGIFKPRIEVTDREGNILARSDGFDWYLSSHNMR